MRNQSRYQDSFPEMLSLRPPRFQLMCLLFSLRAITISISLSFYHGRNQPDQREDFLSNFRQEEKEMFHNGLSPPFTEILVSSGEEYKQPAKENQKYADIERPLKEIPFLTFDKAGVFIVH